MTKPLILAIEPDRRQAAHLTSVVRRRVGAELILVDTTERALSAIGNRMPDLVLVPALLSPQDDAALATALRVVAAAAKVQVLTIPVMASSKPASRAGGVLSALRLGRKAAQPDGCDPDVFADQIASYLARADEERASAATMAFDDEAAVQPAHRPDDQPEQEHGLDQELAPDPLIEDFSIETPAGEAVPDRPIAAAEQDDPVPVEEPEDAGAVEASEDAWAGPDSADVFAADLEEEPARAAAPAVAEVDPPAVAPSEAAAEAAEAPEGVDEGVSAALEEVVAALFAAEPVEPPAPADTLVLDEPAEDEPAAHQPEAPESHVVPIPDAAPMVVADRDAQIVESAAAPEPVPGTEPGGLAQIAAADAVAAGAAADPAEAPEDVQDAAVEELIAALEAMPLPALEIEDVDWSVSGPGEATGADDSLAEMRRVLTGAAMGDFELEVVDIEPPEPIVARAAAPAPAQPAPGAKSEREWVMLIESLRQDVERLRSERTAEPSAAPAKAPRAARPRPVQDEWGFFDPEQCGFAALLAKLDEVTESEDSGAGR